MSGGQQVAPRQTGPERFAKRNEKLRTVAYYGTLVLAVVMVSLFVFRFGVVNGHSMEATLLNKDVIIIWQLRYQPRQGDIVVTNAKNPLDMSLTKRVVATGGQVVEIDDEGLWVDGVAQAEPYLPTEHWEKLPLRVEVPEGTVFLMGDNRDHSTDSRVIGCIPEDDVYGKAVLRVFPFNRIGWL